LHQLDIIPLQANELASLGRRKDAGRVAKRMLVGEISIDVAQDKG
jgi:hypothetical protein